MGNKLRHGDGGKEGNWLGRDLFPKWRIYGGIEEIGNKLKVWDYRVRE